jgi:hypothetical protein
LIALLPVPSEQMTIFFGFSDRACITSFIALPPYAGKWLKSPVSVSGRIAGADRSGPDSMDSERRQ